MRVIPLELRTANELVTKWHRHHKPCQGHRFSIGCVNDSGELVGAAIVGRPVSRMFNQSEVLEITRLVTNGEKNACSFLYSAAARIGKELGYKKIQTYILASENGSSLKASNFMLEDNDCGGGQWKHTDGKPRRVDQPTEKKQRYARVL